MVERSGRRGRPIEQNLLSPRIDCTDVKNFDNQVQCQTDRSGFNDDSLWTKVMQRYPGIQDKWLLTRREATMRAVAGPFSSTLIEYGPAQILLLGDYHYLTRATCIPRRADKQFDNSAFDVRADPYFVTNFIYQLAYNTQETIDVFTETSKGQDLALALTEQPKFLPIYVDASLPRTSVTPQRNLRPREEDVYRFLATGQAPSVLELSDYTTDRQALLNLRVHQTDSRFSETHSLTFEHRIFRAIHQFAYLNENPFDTIETFGRFVNSIVYIKHMMLLEQFSKYVDIVIDYGETALSYQDTTQEVEKKPLLLARMLEIQSTALEQLQSFADMTQLFASDMDDSEKTLTRSLTYLSLHNTVQYHRVMHFMLLYQFLINQKTRGAFRIVAQKIHLLQQWFETNKKYEPFGVRLEKLQADAAKTEDLQTRDYLQKRIEEVNQKRAVLAVDRANWSSVRSSIAEEYLLIVNELNFYSGASNTGKNGENSMFTDFDTIFADIVTLCRIIRTWGDPKTNQWAEATVPPYQSQWSLNSIVYYGEYHVYTLLAFFSTMDTGDKPFADVSVQKIENAFEASKQFLTIDYNWNRQFQLKINTREDYELNYSYVKMTIWWILWLTECERFLRYNSLGSLERTKIAMTDIIKRCLRSLQPMVPSFFYQFVVPAATASTSVNEVTLKQSYDWRHLYENLHRFDSLLLSEERIIRERLTFEMLYELLAQVFVYTGGDLTTTTEARAREIENFFIGAVEKSMRSVTYKEFIAQAFASTNDYIAFAPQLASEVRQLFSLMLSAGITRESIQTEETRVSDDKHTTSSPRTSAEELDRKWLLWFLHAFLLNYDLIVTAKQMPLPQCVSMMSQHQPLIVRSTVNNADENKTEWMIAVRV